MNDYTIPVVEIFGQNEISGLFQNIYAIAAPIMPILMISLAIAFVAYFITVIRRVFSMGRMSKRNFDE